MNDEGPDPLGKQIPLNDLKTEPGAEDLVESEAMRPYLDLAMALAQQKGLRPALEKIASLPLEERYVWRVSSALKWAFADLETMNVVADRRTLSVEDRRQIADLLKLRP